MNYLWPQFSSEPDELRKQALLNLKNNPPSLPHRPQKIKNKYSIQSEFERICLKLSLNPAEFNSLQQGLFWVHEGQHPAMNRVHFDAQQYHGVLNLTPGEQKICKVQFWRDRGTSESQLSENWFSQFLPESTGRLDSVEIKKPLFKQKMMTHLENSANWNLENEVVVPFNTLFVFDCQKFHSIQYIGPSSDLFVSQHYEFFPFRGSIAAT